MNNKYKETLILGHTDFEMRGNLKTKEPAFQEFWRQNEIYQKRLSQNQKRPPFVLHDGPPYANGNLHIGHALNKILKDFIVRWKNAAGYQAPMIFGWDTHGLPIETVITKTGVKRKELPASTFRDLCKTYALEQVEKQMQQFQQLGVFTDWKQRYLTLDHAYEMTELKLFAKMFEAGLIYRDRKPIYWSPTSESALAESEVEYRDVQSPSVFVALAVSPSKLLPPNTHLMIWTTTPWTLIANQLVAIGEELTYVVVKPAVDERHFVLAKNLLPVLVAELGWKDYQVVQECKGKALLGLKYVLPLSTKTSVVVSGHHVSDQSGTGLVHIASGFGEDDYLIARKHQLPIFAPLDDQGCFTSEVEDSEFIGQFYEKTNSLVIARLTKSQKLLQVKPFLHSYPHDWRTKKPVIYRATEQWFINLAKVKDQILTQVQQIQTIPKWAKERLYQVLADRTDWTISRQRLWGVPIIGFYNSQHQLVLNTEILTYALKVLEKHGTNAWFTKPADFFLPPAYQKQGLVKETDILDVWFDSGTSALALEKAFPQFKRPFALYLEGNDQYRGWFNASMINSVIFDGQTPYQLLISHGMTTDEKGHKMSKSAGNGIDPLTVANQLGADVLRLWVASTDYTDDQRIGSEILKQISDNYRKIRNTLRFLLANLDDFNPEKDLQTTLVEVDQFALFQLSEFKKRAAKAYDHYQFNQVYNNLINYVTKDLSAFYFDFIKDILYVEPMKSLRRRQVQTVLYQQLWGLLDILRPLIPHTAEEVYQNWKLPQKALSVHLLDFKEQDFTFDLTHQKKWNQLLAFRNEVNRALEKAKNQGLITKSSEAQVFFELKPEFEFLQIDWPTDLAQILMVAQLQPQKHDFTFTEEKISWLQVKAQGGQKCARCWTLHPTLEDDLCARCFKIVALQNKESHRKV